MVRPSSVLILIVVLSAFSTVAGADLSGMWSGGMGKIDGDRPFWNSAAMNFEISGDELTGAIQSRGRRANFGGTPSLTPRLRHMRVISGKLTWSRSGPLDRSPTRSLLA